jgi:LacI family transcriptional regulator
MRQKNKVLLLIDTSRGGGRKLLYGISRYSRLHGPWIFNRRSVYFLDYQTKFRKFQRLEEETLSMLQEWGADGVIATNINNKSQFDRIVTMGIPAVIIGGYEPNKPNMLWHRVRSDSNAIGIMAAEHLLDRGFRNFAYCGYNNLLWSEERSVGFAKRIQKASFETSFYKPSLRIARGKEVYEQNAIAIWLKSLPKPLGLFACNDDRAQNILEACKIANLDVPGKIAVIGVDNDQLVCEVSEPELTSVQLNNERAGFEAAELLSKLMKGEKIAHQEIIVEPTDIVIRKSTDQLALKDTDVAHAVRFIREHAVEVIQVSDVVEQVPMSRRSLERAFRRILNRSVFEEIKRVHVDQFSRMLLDTNMTISQIAMCLGHPNSQNISRYFREEKGISPLAYRKKHGRILRDVEGF